MQQNNQWDDIDFEDLKIIIPKEIKTTCCKSYLTPKGRCFTCFEQPKQQKD